MKRHLSTMILILVMLAGLSLLLYPTVSDWWNSMHQSRAIATYTDTVSGMDRGAYDALWSEAAAYNAELAQREFSFQLTEEELECYNGVLNVTGDGIMGYIDIPAIDVSLPLYHGTSDAVLQTGIGHIEGSSLPVGGKGSHCVLSGHRGLPSARLFTDLDKLVTGDVFLLQVLDATLTYQVDEIHIVLPHEVDTLAISEGEDLCTLVTCTPYGINSHRLLVRGHRIETETISQARVTADAMQIEPMLVAPMVAAPILLLLLIGLFLPKRRSHLEDLL